MNLYQAGCLGSGANYYCNSHNYPVELHAFTGPVDPNTATWNSLASITAFDKFNPYYVQPAFAPNTRRWAAPIDMTGQVQSWVNGAANYGFSLMLAPQPANWGGPIYASAQDTAYPHPYLSVTYNPTVPSPPLNVAGTAGNGSAQISWTPPASDGGSPIAFYAVNVFNPDGSYANIQTLACATCTSVTVPGLTNGRGYYFGVYAYNNAAGYGAPGYTGFVTPAVPPGAPTNLQGSVSTGWWHSVIGRPDGTVAAFGLNNVGQLGNNTTVDAHVPTVVPGLSGVTQVAAGYAHSLALRNDGTVWAWGYNGYGELGINSTVESNVPVQVPGLTGVVAVSTSFLHNLALKADGTVWAWGYNAYGQLGNNTTVDSRVPIQVPGLANIVSVAAGYAHSLVLRSDGAVFAFGLNNLGQLGNNSTVDAHAPIQVYYVVSAVAVSAGIAHSVALRGDGAVLTWGYNAYGQLGNNTTANAPMAIEVPGLTGVTAISAQGGYDTMARKSDGNLWAFGYNGYGQLGNNSTAQSNVPVQVPGLAGVTQASAGLYHSLAVKADGSLVAFGYNAQGQLGNNSVIDARTPITPTGPGMAAQSATLAAVVAGRTLNVTWAAPAATGGDPITRYALTLYRGTPGAGVLTATQTCSGPCRAATFTALADNSSYYVTVAAVTGGGTGPPATSNSPPSPPSTVVASPGDGAAHVEWSGDAHGNGSPITEYVVTLLPGDTTKRVSAPLLSADIGGLKNGTPYTFKIQAISAVGASPYSSSSNTITPYGKPLPPSSVVAGWEGVGSRAKVGWSPSAPNGSEITAYIVTLYIAEDGTEVRAMELLGTSASFEGLNGDTSYFFTVRARNARGESQAMRSNIVNLDCTRQPAMCGRSSGDDLGIWTEYPDSYRATSGASSVQAYRQGGGIYAIARGEPGGETGYSAGTQAFMTTFTPSGRMAGLGAPSLAAVDTLESRLPDESLTRSIYVERDGVEVVDTLHNSSAPSEFEQSVALPDGWSLALQADQSIQLLDELQRRRGTISEPHATDASGRSLSTTVTVNASLVKVTIGLAGAVFPVTVDPYYYYFGFIENQGYKWRQAQDFEVPERFTVNDYRPGIILTDPDGNIVAVFKVSLEVQTLGLGSYGTRWDFRIEINRPAGFDSEFENTFSLVCRENIRHAADKNCGDIAGASPDFRRGVDARQTDFRYYSDETSCCGPQFLPNRDGTYYFEVTTEPVVAEEFYNGVRYPRSSAAGRYRTHDIRCGRPRQASTGFDSECYFPNTTGLGTGGGT